MDFILLLDEIKIEFRNCSKLGQNKFRM